MAAPLQAITVTFGDCAENGVGMQQLGAAAAEGFSREDLAAAAERFQAAGFRCELVDLVAAAGVGRPGGPAPAATGAWVLLVRDGVAALLGRGGPPDPGALAGAAHRALYAEQRALPADAKALFRGIVKNKLARHNLCFADAAQAPDYAAGRGRVVPWGAVPLTAAARGALGHFFGEKGAGLYAEGNYYYNPAACGIGFHGDGERRRVVALRLGAPIPLHFQWFERFRPVGARVALDPRPGDLYAMSEKAVGTDWRRSVLPTLRHAAGAPKYLRVPTR